MKHMFQKSIATTAFIILTALTATPVFAANHTPTQTIRYKIEAFQIPAGADMDASNPTAVRDAYAKNQLFSAAGNITAGAQTNVTIASKAGEKQAFSGATQVSYVSQVLETLYEDGTTDFKVDSRDDFDGWHGSVTTSQISGSAVSFNIDANFTAIDSLAHVASLAKPGTPEALIMAPLYRPGGNEDIHQDIKVRIAEPTVVRVGKTHILIVTATLS